MLLPAALQAVGDTPPPNVPEADLLPFGSIQCTSNDVCMQGRVSDLSHAVVPKLKCSRKGAANCVSSVLGAECKEMRPRGNAGTYGYCKMTSCKDGWVIDDEGIHCMYKLFGGSSKLLDGCLDGQMVIKEGCKVVEKTEVKDGVCMEVV